MVNRRKTGARAQQGPALNPAQLAADDRRYIWHPFTQMQDWLQEEPLIIERGEGSYLIDVQGRRYLDGVSSLWCILHGHNRPEINAAIHEQVERISHSTFLGLSNVPAVQLARELVRIAPRGLTKVFYSDNGSTAVEIALKMAFQYWQQRPDPRPNKRSFIALTNGYHGDTLGAVSVGGIDLFHQVYKPLVFPVAHAPSAYCYRCHLGKSYPSCALACLDDVEATIARHADEACAVVMEPRIQGAGGMIAFPPGWTRRVWEAAKSHGLLFIADEVATGFGRTGALFACEAEDIAPDILCLAKGLTGGYLPLAATLTTEEVFNAFLAPYESRRTFFHGHTFTANPVACAAALANLAIFRTDDTLSLLPEKIAYLAEGLQRFRELAHVGDVRQAGLMVGIELVQDRATKAEYPYADKLGMRVIQEARRRGAIIRPLGDVIVLMPHLTFSKEELAGLLDITYQSIKKVTEG